MSYSGSREEVLTKKRVAEKERRKNWTQEEREAWNARCAIWRKNNQAKVRKIQRNWRKKNIEKARESNRKWEKNNPDKIRNKHYLRCYGITVEQYEEMLAKNNSGCWICGRKAANRRLAVDHCHISGTVRGILCMHCNAGLRKFFDRPDLLTNAAKYLENSGAFSITPNQLI